MPPSADNEEGRNPDNENREGGQGASTAAPPPPPPPVTGYVGSVRDDLTAFVSAEREAAACAEGGEAGAVSRTLAILARLGEDLGRMARLKGRVEHQVRALPPPLEVAVLPATLRDGGSAVENGKRFSLSIGLD